MRVVHETVRQNGWMGRHHRARQLDDAMLRQAVVHERRHAVSKLPAECSKRQSDRALPHVVHASEGLAGPPRRHPFRRRGKLLFRLFERQPGRFRERLPHAVRIRSDTVCEDRLQHVGRQGDPLERRVVHRRPGPLVDGGHPSQRLSLHDGKRPYRGRFRTRRGGRQTAA